MKKRLIYIWAHLQVVILGVVLSTSCADDGFEHQEGMEGQSITFILNLPKANVIETRANNSADDDNQITNLYILAFDKDSKLKEVHPFYNNENLPFYNNNDHQRKFTLIVDLGYELVALANVTDKLFRTAKAGTTNVSSLLTIGETKSVIASKLATYYDADYKGVDYKWPHSNNGYTTGDYENCIPMWGELKGYGYGKKNEFNMIRMLAQINVSNVTKKRPDEFEMTAVYYCNYARKAYLMVEDGKYDAQAKKVTGISFSRDDLHPTGRSEYEEWEDDEYWESNWDVRAIKYSGNTDLVASTTDSIKNSCKILAFEIDTLASFPSKATEPNWFSLYGNWKNLWDDNPCLIIAGKYKNGAETYYRVDFIDNEDNWLNILRNHRYEVMIKEVRGPGYTSYIDAIKSAPMNMNVTTYVSNESEEGITVVDGPYFLTIPQLEYTVVGDVVEKSESKKGNCEYKQNGITAVKIRTNQENLFSSSYYKIFLDEECKNSIGRNSGITLFTLGETDYSQNGDNITLRWTSSNIVSTSGQTGVITSHPDDNLTNENRVRYFKLDSIGRMRMPIGVIKVTQIHKVIPYVGAFWKHDERAERLIRMKLPEGYSYDWEATVVEGKEWIRMDTEPSPAFAESATYKVTYKASTENPRNPEEDGYYVTGGTTSVRGSTTKDTKKEDAYIYFRLGLEGEIGPEEHRYGVVLLTYTNKETNYTIQRKIWIRQGEAADYLMREEDMQDGYSRVKFSPYNLTAPAFKNNLNYTGKSVTLDLTKGIKGVFTDYPSQAGAYIKGNSTLFFNPVESHSNGLNPNGNYVGSYWNAATHETCPNGYYRPSSGANNVIKPSNADSELYRSLSQNLNNLTNSDWGYYADGFFDRRQIMDADGKVDLSPVDRPWPLSAVSKGKTNVAYIGRLFYNPYNHASIFFPAAGRLDYEYPSHGYLEANIQVGGHCHYYSTSMYSKNDGTGFGNVGRIHSLTAHYKGTNMTNLRNTFEAASVRCIKRN